MSRRRRGLTADEVALWRQVTAGVTPLRGRPGDDVGAEPQAPAADAAEPAETRPEALRPKRAGPPALPPLAAIDRNERRRLARGARTIDRRLDLHGLRQGEAHGALRHFLHESQSRGHSFVLVITGKGRALGEPMALDERGVLRRLVPHWLRHPDMRPLVLGFEEAEVGHGGGGALYVRLRRVRRLDRS
jgi:DNA-nicking Smr family endonuclease